MKANQRRGLTVIEVLAIAAIIAFLMLLLEPFLDGNIARGAAMRAVCLSNLHQFQAAMLSYAAANRNLMPCAGNRDTPHWTVIVAKAMGDKNPYANPNQIPFDKRPIYQCPEREKEMGSPFLDYVSNAMNPGGPDANGRWTGLDFMRLNAVKKPSEIVFLADMEREDKNTARAGESLLSAHDYWAGKVAGVPPHTKGVELTDVWCPEQLPEGMDGINTGDQPGPRRVARNLHTKRYTNAGFLDGAVLSLPLCPRTWTDGQKHTKWLQRFGVADSTVRNLLNNVGPDGKPNDAVMHGLNPSR